MSARLGRLVGLAGVLTCVAAAALPSQALATPEMPTLIGTHPVSPGTSTAPRVYGTLDSIHTSVLRGPVGWSGLSTPVTPFAEEPVVIVLFAASDCGGTEVARGSVSELEGPGIRATVLAGSTTVFSALSEAASGPSGCSNDVSYRQVEEPPAAPTLAASEPASPANDNSPRLLGTAPAGSTVSLYATPDCSGSPVATGSAGELESGGIAVAVADNSTTVFHAKAAWAELPSACSSSSVTYREVTPPVEVGGGAGGEAGGEGSGGSGSGAGAGGTPAAGTGVQPTSSPPSTASSPPSSPRLRMVPGGRANDASPSLGGTAPGADRVQVFAGAECAAPSVLSVSVPELEAGVPVAVAANAESVFSARATNGVGHSHCSEPVSYFEDSTPPRTRVTFGPAVKTKKTSTAFRFADISDDGPGTSFKCKIDAHPWRTCISPLHLSHLKPVEHLFKVKAIDAAGNVEVSPQVRHFRVVKP